MSSLVHLQSSIIKHLTVSGYSEDSIKKEPYINDSVKNNNTSPSPMDTSPVKEEYPKSTTTVVNGDVASHITNNDISSMLNDGTSPNKNK